MKYVSWLHLITVLAVCAGIHSGRSEASEDDPSSTPTPKVCADGLSKFGKLSCSGVSNSDTILDAYFLGASSLEEIEKNFPERFERLKQVCQKKIIARQVASAPADATIEAEPVQFKVETVDSCNGKKGFQEPCVHDEDCLENVCHPLRGTCSAVFTVPVPYGN